MNKIIKVTMSIFKNQEVNFYYTIPYSLSQQISQNFEILELYCFAFTTYTIDKTFTQRYFFRARVKFGQFIFQYCN